MFPFADLSHPLAGALSENEYEQIVFRLVRNRIVTGEARFADLVRSLPSVYPAAVLQAIDKLAETSSAARLAATTARSSSKFRPRRGTYTRLVPHPLDYDWRFTREAINYMLHKAESVSSAKSIWIGLGTPSLFQPDSGRRRILLDSNPKVSVLVRNTVSTELRICNLLYDDIPDISGDVIVLDPPWYHDETTAFLWTARKICRPQGTVLLAVPQIGTRPGMREEFDQLAKWIERLGFAIVGFDRDVLSYQSPPFEYLALRAAGVMNYPMNWRRGDLLALQPRSASVVSRPGVDSERQRWEEITFDQSRLRVVVDNTNDYRSPLLLSLTSCDSPASVSRRDSRKRCAKLWTSSNRIFDTAAPWVVYEIARALADRRPVRAAIEQRLHQKLTSDQRREIAVATRQLRSLIASENQDTATISNRLSRQASSRRANRRPKNAIAKIPLLRELNVPSKAGLHVGVFVEPFLKFILEGKKTVESRFSITRRAPFKQVQAGDIVLLKRSGGPIVGACRVAQAWFYALDAKSWKHVRREFAERLCAEDPAFWSTRGNAKFATLLRIEDVRSLPPLKFAKTDRRGWVILRRALPNTPI